MLNVHDYTICTELFIRMLGAIYFFAFGAFLFQIRGLIGSGGILPIQNFLNAIKQRFGTKSYYVVPSLFWINASDAALMGVVWVGTALSALLFLNIHPPILIPIIFVLYTSIVSTGQNFLSFGWEHFLLEVTANAFFLSLTTVPNIFIWISINFLLLRFHFQGGIVKLLSSDINWRNMTAVAYHYQTQPIPNTIAWYVHKLPLWFHQLSTALMFFIELVVPFGILAGENVRFAVYILLVGLQVMIWATGNLSFLNYLTVVLCTILLSNKFLGVLFAAPAIPEPTSLALTIFLSVVGAVLIFLQVINVWNHLMAPNPIFSKILNWLSPFRIINRYGIFAVMTTKRYEIVIEGSDDGVTWKEYLFYHKPSEVDRRPRRISPYQPRIDWQVWFLPFSSFQNEHWFQQFLSHLLLGSPQVLKLLRKNPFPDKPPKFIRALYYDYVFTDFETKKRTGHWWKRELLGNYSPTLQLRT